MCIDASCHREFQKVNVVSSGTIPSQSCMCEVCYGLIGSLPPFYMCPWHNKPLIDLFKEKKFLLKTRAYTRTSISSMMVPHLSLIVFHYKTSTCSCLSWTVCSHACSRTSSCFGACYRRSFPEKLATSSRWFVLQTFFPDMLSEISRYQPNLNLRQI